MSEMSLWCRRCRCDVGDVVVMSGMSWCRGCRCSVGDVVVVSECCMFVMVLIINLFCSVLHLF